jgi:peptidoglycan/xylan/chitin deacetylase (PgdA/CDA1 family)
MKKLASLSLDLDNKWSYLKTHGNPSWREYPSYLNIVVPRILGFLEQHQAKITFFIVAQDAALEENHAALKSLADAGHEIANHSFNHDPWLHQYDEQYLNEELATAEQHIAKVTGKKPVGFRGPGFSLSTATLRVLINRGYEYDCTVFPNLLNPLARAYFFATSNLTKEEKEQRKALFGTWRDALRPVKPFIWNIDNKQLLEIPVTTMPIFKIPIHMSYVLYLAKYSRAIAMLYIRFALALCRLTGTEPSILLHPLDFLGEDDDGDLRFFPGMDMPSEKKIAMVDTVMRLLRSRYSLVTMHEHAQAIRRRKLNVIAPVFQHNG